MQQLAAITTAGAPTDPHHERGAKTTARRSGSSVGKCRQQLLTHGRWQRRPLSRRFSRCHSTPEKLNPAMHRHTTQVKHTTHSITKHRAARHGESCGTRVVSCFSFFVSGGPVTNRGGGRGGRKHRKALSEGAAVRQSAVGSPAVGTIFGVFSDTLGLLLK